MRVLRLDLGRNRVELHPFVTVVRGLTPELRARLLEVMGGLPAGQSSVGGLIEAHGVLLDLAPATLDLLDLTEPLDVVVAAHDLPGASNGPVQGRSAAEPTAPRAEAALVAARAAAAAAEERSRAAAEALAAVEAGGAGGSIEDDPSVAPSLVVGSAQVDTERLLLAAEARRQAAASELAEAEAEAERARAARSEASQAVSRAAAALESAGEHRDTTAAALVEAARARLAEAEATLERVRAGERTAPAAELPDLEALQVARLTAQASLLALDTTDPLPVRAALDQLRRGDVADLLPSPEALALADELAAVEAQAVRTPGVGTEQAGVQHEERALARRRVELAEQALEELEAAARRPVYDPADVAALEKAHLDLIDAREGAGKRFGAARAARRLEEVEQIEQQVLDRMGLLTYTEFLMYAGGSSAASQAEGSLSARVEAARDELARAEAQLESREIDVIDELARAEIIDRRRALRARAIELIGADPGEDIDGALRRLRVEATATGGHLKRLRDALDGAGLSLADEDVDEQLLIDLAKVWLREQDETEAQRRAFEQEIAAIDVQLAAVEARAAGPEVDEPLAVAAAAVEDARQALEAAERRLAREDEAAAGVEELRVAFGAASAADAQSAADVVAAEARVQAGAQGSRVAAEAIRALEARLATAKETDAASTAAAAAQEERLVVAQAGGRQALIDELALDESALATARAEVAAAEASLAEARRADAEAAVAPRAAAPLPAAGSQAGSLDDIEWYLLARVAAQRSVSYAGSVPLVIDDALAGMARDDARAVLSRLERMAATVQLVVVSEDLATAAWAEALGEDRAQVTEVGATAT